MRKLLTALLLTLATTAHAHSMYQAALLLDYHRTTLDAELQLPLSRLEKSLPQPISAEALRTYLLERLHAQSSDHQPWLIELTQSTTQQIEGAPYLVAQLRFTPPAGAPLRTLTLQDDLLTDTTSTQVTLVSVRSDWNSSTFANDPELLGVLTAEDHTLVIDRAPGSWTHGFRSVFHLGTRHIAEGTDHLLFLLALLLPAPLLYTRNRWTTFAGTRRSLFQILKVVTAFTIGHSITLALAASGLVHVPGHPIEILIAISILISAIHAARPLFPGLEAFIAAGFGLIHGLAFATTLAELGLHRAEQVASIFAFNLGIEAMQLLVVLCVLPSLVLLSQTPAYTPFRLLGATFAGLAATGWIFERASGHSLHIDTVVDRLAAHGPLYAALLFAASALLFLFRKRLTT